MTVLRKPRPNCAVCGAAVDKPPSMIRTATPTCSVRCCGIYQRRRETVQCSTCGKEMDRPISRARRYTRHFCSRACADGDRARRLVGVGCKWFAGGKAEVSCDHCGKTLLLFPSRLKRSDRHFCSLSCRSAYRSAHESRELSPLWKGGGSGRSRRAQTYWARGVKRRAGDRCKLCGAMAGLHAHHVRPYADNVELREDQDNGICLCKECHGAVHHGKIDLERKAVQWV